MPRYGRRTPWAVCALCALLGGCASSPPEPAPAESPAVIVASSAEELLPRIESRAFVQANQARTRAGLDELEMRLDLMDVAREHAVDMAERGYFSHYSPEGTGPGERADRFGIRYWAFAENLARIRHSPDPASLAVLGWLKSPGHRRNLLDETYTGYRYTGIGVARGEDGAIYLSQVFLK